MAKRKPKIVQPEPVQPKYLYYMDHLPKQGECRCWYCGYRIAVDGVECTTAPYIILLSGDFACKSCQDKVKTPAYAKARASYMAWLHAQEKRHINYARFNPLKLTVS